jgi:hypothetical protein
MVGGRAVAILGLGALGAAAGAMLAGGTVGSHREALRVAMETREAVKSAAAFSSRELAEEVAAAAAVPELRAALGNKVDTFTLDDLFQTEDWWAPHRTRALVLVGPNGVIMSHNVPSAGTGAPALAALAVKNPGAASFARVGEQVYLVAAGAVGGVEPPPHVLVLARPLDGALLDAWAARAQTGLILSDGRQSLRAAGAHAGQPPELVGHEAEPVVIDTAAAAMGAAVELAPGLWVWGVRPLGDEKGRVPTEPLWALAGLLGLAAVGAALAGRRRVAAPLPTASSIAVATTPPPPTSSAIAQAPTAGTGFGPGKRPSVNLPTMIASGEAQVFGRYTVLDRLGAGGMCDIYTAALTGPEGFQRTFVLKRLKPELALNRSAVDQFIDEAKLGSTLVHSNIVPVFDFGRVGDGYFIAQEYIVGRNIAQLCERHEERLGEPLDVGTVLYVAHETLQALGYAHDKTNDAGEPQHIVHRDVSPGNVVVSRIGEVKLIDFGIVKSADRVSHTDLGNVKGNASFMAPEQARGLAVDRRADLFSLGLVMYRALSGESFYPGATTAEVFYGAATGPTAEHFDRVDRLPPAAARIIKKALMPDPADRYATAEEFAADLVPHIPLGAKAALATLLNALFGAELRSGGGGTGATASLRRDVGGGT